MKKLILLFLPCFFLIVYIFLFSNIGIVLKPEIINYIPEKFTIKSGGSTSMSRLLNVLGEEFNKLNPGYFLEKSETGSGAAINEVLNGNYDLGDISRYLKPEENIGVGQFIIAFDGIAVIVNKKNPIENITSEQIKKIFRGDAKNWYEFLNFNSQITTVGREEASGTREGFENYFNLNEKNVKSNYTVELSESGDIVSRVSSEEGAIGYVSYASKSENIKVIKIDGIDCNIKNMENGSYKLTRPFIQIYKENNNNNILKKWAEFIYSEPIKEIIKEEKYFK